MTIALTLQKYLVASVVSDARQDCALLVSPCYRFNLHHLGLPGRNNPAAEAECYIKESPTTVNSELPSDSAFGALSQGCCSGSLDTLLARHR